MTKVKESSTRYANKQATMLECPVTYFIERIGGHWKAVIIYHLIPGPRRYSELRKVIPAITEKVLIQQLKQLEADKLIVRKARPVVPPYVTYRLTAMGKELVPVLRAMAFWAIKDSRREAVDQYGILEPGISLP